jgi:hypothetical protein
MLNGFAKIWRLNQLGNRNYDCYSIVHGFYFIFVIKVQSDSKYDNELVVEEYYKHDAVLARNETGSKCRGFS